MMRSTAYFVDLGEQHQQQQQQQQHKQRLASMKMNEPANPLTERKPGTPTKARGNNNCSIDAGEENKTQACNQLAEGPLMVKSMNGAGKPQLPERLQKRLASLPGRPSAEQIRQKEEQVEMKREEMLKAKVMGAAQFGAKVQEVRARKDEFNRNILGCCGASAGAAQPSAPPAPVKLPGRLQKRLRNLKAASAARAKPVLEKEAQTAARREARLRAVADKQAAHLATVAARKEAKATEARFEAASAPDFLPANLKARLESLRRPTKEAILRKEALAEAKHRLVLEAKAKRASDHMVVVEQARATKKAFVANEVDFGSANPGAFAVAVKLPKRLALRAERLAPKWTPDSVVASHEGAAARQRELMEMKMAKARAHLTQVSKLREAKTTEARFPEFNEASSAAEPAAAAAGVDAASVQLPERLRARLAAFTRPTKEALLRKEALAAKRAELHTAAKAQAARVHNEVAVPRARALKESLESNNILLATSADTKLATPVALPKRLAKRLVMLRAGKPAWTSEAQLAKEAAAEQRRRDMLEGVMAGAAEHSAKVAKLSANKKLEPRFGNNKIPAGLPENLRTRLEGARRRTPEAILRKNELASVRRSVALAARAHIAHQRGEAARAAVALKHSMAETGMELASGQVATATPLPRALARRAAKLAPRWTPEGLVGKEAAAGDTLRASLAAKAAKARKHNRLAASRAAAKAREPRFAAEAAAPELPEHLRSRLASLTRPRPEAIRRKLAAASQRREIRLESLRHRAREAAPARERARALHADLEQNQVWIVRGSPEPLKLPKRLAARAESLASQAQARGGEASLRREEAAAARHEALLRARRTAARTHVRRAMARRQAKETEARFPEGAPAGVELPAALAARLAALRKPTDAAVLRKLELAAKRAQLAREAKAHAASMHLAHAAKVRQVRDTYRDSMQLLTKGETVAVALPKRLRARLASLEAAKKSPSALLAKEAAAGARRHELLAARCDKLAAHAAKVREVWTLRKTKPRFAEEDISSAPLPKRLKERLKTYRSPTGDVIRNKEARAQQRRQSKLAAKAKSAHSHQEYVLQVKALKQEFIANQVSFAPDDRDESPSLPASLQSKLDKRSSPKSAEQIREKETAVQNQRDAILHDRVHARQLHSQKVDEILQKHREQAAKPETD
ncbi:Hypothetical Protein FCC1311_085252 [Hondaea fermentalgiana]|uniref:Uncharacterized protein n=1 Tax=Hondaea fermentalgiana TaxID=2315210 RepID=A0A2R5GN30_9STRA|nr:Hypothetical Protein FCC1311_085252 [Hondaea fermentalgiana]|eukprot:GBG32300.1 Hypothetical Protein FCC1311_085252 [Hondaea fermentalgiana]